MDVIDVALDKSLIVELYGIGHESADGLDMTEQLFRVRMLLTEIAVRAQIVFTCTQVLFALTQSIQSRRLINSALR